MLTNKILSLMSNKRPSDAFLNSQGNSVIAQGTQLSVTAWHVIPKFGS